MGEVRGGVSWAVCVRVVEGRACRVGFTGAESRGQRDLRVVLRVLSRVMAFGGTGAFWQLGGIQATQLAAGRSRGGQHQGLNELGITVQVTQACTILVPHVIHGLCVCIQVGDKMELENSLQNARAKIMNLQVGAPCCWCSPGGRGGGKEQASLYRLTLPPCPTHGARACLEMHGWLGEMHGYNALEAATHLLGHVYKAFRTCALKPTRHSG